MSDSLPGIELDESLGWFRSAYLYAKRMFQAQSVRPNVWVAPMRQEILEQYIKLNNALTQWVLSLPSHVRYTERGRKSPRIADLTQEPYRDEVLALARNRDPNHLYRWNFHREVTPTRILSLRAADGEYSTEMPETGSRVAVQALVRFDTEQVRFTPFISRASLISRLRASRSTTSRAKRCTHPPLRPRSSLLDWAARRCTSCQRSESA